MQALEAVLVDDEAPARTLLRDLLSDHPEVRVVGEAGSVPEAISVIRRTRPTLVFLDIRLGRASGFDLLAELPVPPPRIVFVTAFGQYAVRAFDNDAVDYLLKPLDPARLARTIERLRNARGTPDAESLMRALRVLIEKMPATGMGAAATGEESRQGTPRPRFVARDGDQFMVIDVARVTYIEADKNYVWFETDGKRVRARYAINDVEASLDADKFLRLSRSVIVQAGQIQGFERNFRGKLLITLKSGRRVVCTAGYREGVLRYLGV